MVEGTTTLTNEINEKELKTSGPYDNSSKLNYRNSIMFLFLTNRCRKMSLKRDFFPVKCLKLVN